MGTSNFPGQSGWKPPPERLPYVRVPIGSWARQARCANAPDPEIFFPGRGPGEADAAKAVCADCPVRRECLQYALRAPEEHGVWGGLDEKERADLIQRGQSAAGRPTRTPCSATRARTSPGPRRGPAITPCSGPPAVSDNSSPATS